MIRRRNRTVLDVGRAPTSATFDWKQVLYLWLPRRLVIEITVSRWEPAPQEETDAGR